MLKRTVSKHSMEFIGKTDFNEKKNNRKINTVAKLGTKKISSRAVVSNCSQRHGFSCGKTT